MNKVSFLTTVANVMKGMIPYDVMMASLQRSCMRGETANLELMSREEERVDQLIQGIRAVEGLCLADDILDVLVLRYLRNTQFLANVPETDIDVSSVEEGDLNHWKKTLLYRTPDFPHQPPVDDRD